MTLREAIDAEGDIGALRRAGYDAAFYSVEEGTARYIEHLLQA